MKHLNNDKVEKLAEMLAKELITRRVAVQDAKVVFKISALAEILMEGLINYTNLVAALPDVEWEQVKALLPPETNLTPAKERMLQDKVMKHQKQILVNLISVKKLLGDWFDELDEIPEQNRDMLDKLGNLIYKFFERNYPRS